MTIDIPKHAKVVRIDSLYNGRECKWVDWYSIRTPKGNYRDLQREPPETVAGIIKWFQSMGITHVAVAGGWHAISRSKLYKLDYFARVLRKMNKVSTQV